MGIHYALGIVLNAEDVEMKDAVAAIKDLAAGNKEKDTWKPHGERTRLEPGIEITRVIARKCS